MIPSAIIFCLWILRVQVKPLPTSSREWTGPLCFPIVGKFCHIGALLPVCSLMHVGGGADVGRGTLNDVFIMELIETFEIVKDTLVSKKVIG